MHVMIHVTLKCVDISFCHDKSLMCISSAPHDLSTCKLMSMHELNFNYGNINIRDHKIIVPLFVFVHVYCKCYYVSRFLFNN